MPTKPCVKDLLPVIDNFERAIGHASSSGNGKLLVEGVEMVLKGFLDTLANMASNGFRSRLSLRSGQT